MFARFLTAQDQNWLTTYLRKSDRFLSLYVRGAPQTLHDMFYAYIQFIFDCSCIETDAGRPAYSEPLFLHKNYN